MRDWRADSRPDLLRSAHQRSCRLSGMLGKQRCFLVSKSGTLSNPRSEFATRSEQPFIGKAAVSCPSKDFLRLRM